MQGFADVMIDIIFDVLAQMINAKIIELTAVGTENVAKATAIDAAGNRMEAICFHDAQEFAKQCERNNGKMSITFYPGINEFRGERQIQIVITHYR